MIGSYLRDIDERPRICLACQTESATLVIFEPISDLAPPELESIHGTRCDACGDVRLYQLLKDGTTDAEIRYATRGFLKQKLSKSKINL